MKPLKRALLLVIKFGSVSFGLGQICKAPFNSAKRSSSECVLYRWLSLTERVSRSIWHDRPILAPAR